VELLERALAGNTVVCMGSASGRLFIAVSLMKELARQDSQSAGRQISIFLVDDGQYST